MTIEKPKEMVRNMPILTSSFIAFVVVIVKKKMILECKFYYLYVSRNQMASLQYIQLICDFSIFDLTININVLLSVMM